MNFSLATLKQKASTLISHGSGPHLASSPIVHPVRDWKIILLGFSVAVLSFGFFAFLPYAGVLEGAAEVEATPTRSVKLDREALSKMAAALSKRQASHQATIQSGSAFVDPGR